MAVVFPYVKAAAWVDGSTTDTAAKRNTIEDGIFNAHQQPAVRVFHNTTQSITSGVETTLAFNSERFDQAGGAASTQHDTVTNNSRLTCLYAGVYQITATITWASGPSNSGLLIRLNGVTRIGYIENSGATASVTTLYALAVNDYVEARVVQTSGSPINIASSAAQSPEFMMVRVG